MTRLERLAQRSANYPVGDDALSSAREALAAALGVERG